MEGPSIHIAAEELQIFVNKTINKVYGNASFEKEVLVHQRIHEIFVFGKRLVIQFDIHALVISSYLPVMTCLMQYHLLLRFIKVCQSKFRVL
jgi:endonuclease VIII